MTNFPPSPPPRREPPNVACLLPVDFVRKLTRIMEHVDDAKTLLALKFGEVTVEELERS